MTDKKEDDDSNLHTERYQIKRGEMQPVSDAENTLDAEVEVGDIKSSPNLARDHLYMAIMFADKAKTIEDEYDNPGIKRTEYRYYAMSSVIASFSFVDACINELIHKGITTEDGGPRVNLEHGAALDIIQNHTYVNLDMMGTLDKYELMLAIADQEQFNTHGQMYENITLVNNLRTALIHHKPQFDTISADNIEQFMGDKLHSKFETNPFVSGGLFFPYQCMSFGCAKWAIESCLNFTEDFYSRVDVNKPYTIPDADFTIELDDQDS